MKATRNIPPFRAAVIAWAVVLLLVGTALGGQFSGRVVGVMDGDTIEVLHEGRGERIRLQGIDSPEKKQPFGQAAKQFTSDLAFGKTVTVDVRDHDRYGRTVGEVVLPDGQSLNRALVAGGYAWWYRQYSDDRSLGELETKARAKRLGLWSDGNAVPPWEFRHPKKSNHQEVGLTPQASSSQNAEAAAPVYVTQSGRKYHLIGCRYLNDSAKTISLGEAMAKGYTPCAICGRG